jgi:hypothetical protein
LYAIQHAIFTDWEAVSHQRPAQHGIAADRCAREIGGFLAAYPARSRHLNAKPLGGSYDVLDQ